MTQSLSNLLRRTTAILGAILALAFAGSAAAQQSVTLVGVTSNTCTFSGALTVSPNGALSITCNAGTQTSPVFTLLAPASLNINTTGNTQTTVTRSATPTGLGTLLVNYTISGAGCVNTGGSLSFPDGDTTPQAISISTGPTGATTCDVSISVPSGSVASPASASISVIDPNAGGGSTGANGCPAQDPSALAVNVTFATALPQVQKSGIIGFTPVPAPTVSTKASVRYEQSIGTSTANTMHTEFSVSKCPGAILTPTSSPAVASQCYVSSDNTTDIRLDIYTKAIYTWTDQTSLGNRGCWAPGPGYYMNYRWTYSSCPYGACGFVMQWFNGPY